MIEAPLISTVGGILIGGFIFVMGLVTEIRRWKNAPRGADIIPKNDSSQNSPHSTKSRSEIQTETENRVYKFIFDAIFGGTITWVTIQLVAILFSLKGVEIILADPWYGDSSTLLIITAIFGFQTFRYVYGVVKSR